MKQKTKIESLGVYLPDKEVTTAELIDRCRRKPRWDLERITGIRERRVAEGEYAIDLAVKAARKALAMSRYRVEDLGMIICTSISKNHRENEVAFEPATGEVLLSVGPARSRALSAPLCPHQVDAPTPDITTFWRKRGQEKKGTDLFFVEK